MFDRYMYLIQIQYSITGNMSRVFSGIIHLHCSEHAGLFQISTKTPSSNIFTHIGLIQYKDAVLSICGFLL